MDETINESGGVTGGEAGIRILRTRLSKWLMARDFWRQEFEFQPLTAFCVVLVSLPQSPGFHRCFGDMFGNGSETAEGIPSIPASVHPAKNWREVRTLESDGSRTREVNMRLFALTSMAVCLCSVSPAAQVADRPSSGR